MTLNVNLRHVVLSIKQVFRRGTVNQEGLVSSMDENNANDAMKKLDGKDFLGRTIVVREAVNKTDQPRRNEPRRFETGRNKQSEDDS